MLRAMKSGRPTYLSIAITFVIALAFYFIAYNWLTRRQTARGPWQVVFTNTTSGVPELLLTPPQLGLSNVHVQFVGETIPPTTPDVPERGKPIFFIYSLDFPLVSKRSVLYYPFLSELNKVHGIHH